MFVASLSKITGKTYDERNPSVFPRFAEDGKSFLLDIDGKRIRYDMATKKCQEEKLPKREPYKYVACHYFDLKNVFLFCSFILLRYICSDKNVSIWKSFLH